MAMANLLEQHRKQNGITTTNKNIVDVRALTFFHFDSNLGFEQVCLFLGLDMTELG